MKHLKLVFITLFSTLVFVSCSSDDTDSTPTVTLNPLEAYEELNIPYGEATDQVFDLYLPPNRTDETKTIILVHGGGWTSGDKVDMNEFKTFIIEQMSDYAVVNINYRLADETHLPYPMQIEDISSVVDFLNTNKDYYTISDNIGFLGASAGAHLALLWSYAFDNNNQVDMVCSFVGPTNFTDPAYIESTNPLLQLLISTLGIDINDDAFLEEISPYHNATTAAPPTILFYGGQDPLVPTSQGTAMRDKLEELNVTHEFTLYPEEGHGWEGLNLIDSTLKLKTFIENHL
ncbi:alpha/beta hydrolase [Winogradskyella vidalii]|uniref:alpha/beta hydrolase n=1 Tax=Winogradskyella vidalii TaxID=2615024 RepID=UPI0015C92112|nr:alpha/beta hydrolase [Winogradskyella vidalii]